MLLAALSVLSFSSLPSILAQTAVPPGSDPTPPEISGSPADHTTGSSYTPTQAQINALSTITNFVIVPFGAQSFDSIMGTFSGANGISSYMSSSSYTPQKDANGNAYTYLPPFTDSTSKVTMPGGVIPNAPYDIMATIPNITLSTIVGNPSHSFFQQKFKHNGGKQDGFVAYGGSLATLSMAYYNLSQYAPNNGLFALAKQYTLFDRFHVSSISDSVAQHLYFVGGTTFPYDSTMPGQCPADVVALYNITLFPQTFTNGSGTYMTSWTQQPPLNRQCYFIGELNSANLCSGSPPFLPLIPNGVSNPKQIGDVFDIYRQCWAWYAEDFLGAESTDCTQPGQRQFDVQVAAVSAELDRVFLLFLSRLEEPLTAQTRRVAVKETEKYNNSLKHAETSTNDHTPTSLPARCGRRASWLSSSRGSDPTASSTTSRPIKATRTARAAVCPLSSCRRTTLRPLRRLTATRTRHTPSTR